MIYLVCDKGLSDCLLYKVVLRFPQARLLDGEDHHPSWVYLKKVSYENKVVGA